MYNYLSLYSVVAIPDFSDLQSMANILSNEFLVIINSVFNLAISKFDMLYVAAIT